MHMQSMLDMVAFRNDETQWNIETATLAQCSCNMFVSMLLLAVMHPVVTCTGKKKNWAHNKMPNVCISSGFHCVVHFV